MENVLLIDALYINNGGGKVLLDYLIQQMQKTSKKVFYLLDKRVEDKVPFIDKNQDNFTFLQASLLNRHQFYLKNKSKFSTVFCFGDLPPNIKLEAKVFTYFHQPLYLKLPKDLPVLDKIMFTIKSLVLHYLSNKTNFWMVQTDTIKNSLQKKFNIHASKILVLPFYPPMERNQQNVKVKNSYIYISNAAPHKNHTRLIIAFCAFYDKHKTGELILTIDSNFTDLLQVIQDKINQNYPIKNIGFVHWQELKKVYQNAEYLIFPSLAESFGLGIVEAIDMDCKVIGSDLEYLHAVCTPSIVFNPLNENSIIQALEKSLSKNIPPSISKMENKIKEVLSML